jgi:hypothetical protein
MIRLASAIAAVMICILFWHECGEDLGVFCYRIGMGAFTALRSRALVVVPVSQNRLARTRAACSRQFGISSTHYIVRTDFES